jgi:hypothetical protein
MKTKCLLTAGCILLLTYNFAYAQKANRKLGKIGITFSSLGTNYVNTGNAVCDCGYNMERFYDVGITYIYPINHWLGIETGLTYSRRGVQIDSFHLNPNHNITSTTSQSNFALLDIPLTVRVNFLHYLFANGGLLVAIDPNKSDPIGKQTGLGEMVGLGAKYEFKAGLSLFVNPYMKFYSNILHKDQHRHFKLSEGGFRFGIAFNL